MPSKANQILLGLVSVSVTVKQGEKDVMILISNSKESALLAPYPDRTTKHYKSRHTLEGQDFPCSPLFLTPNKDKNLSAGRKRRLQEGKQHGGGMVASHQKREGSMENLSLGNPKVKRTRVQLQFQKPQTHRSTLHCRGQVSGDCNQGIRNSPLGFPAAPKGMVKIQVSMSPTCIATVSTGQTICRAKVQHITWAF